MSPRMVSPHTWSGDLPLLGPAPAREGATPSTAPTALLDAFMSIARAAAVSLTVCTGHKTGPHQNMTVMLPSSTGHKTGPHQKGW